VSLGALAADMTLGLDLYSGLDVVFVKDFEKSLLFFRVALAVNLIGTKIAFYYYHI